MDTGRMARAIHDRISAECLKNGLAPLAWSSNLVRLAEHHSRDMAQHTLFGHTNPSGQEPEDRAVDAGMPVPADREPMSSETLERICCLPTAIRNTACIQAAKAR